MTHPADALRADPGLTPCIEARVRPPGEEWRARIEREITGRRPFANKVLDAYYTDERWNGLGLYAHFGDLAARELRQEYLHGLDFVAYRNGLFPLERSAEGLHVRVRPGTTGIPEHLYGCPITVEYVDLPSQADVAAVAGGGDGGRRPPAERAAGLHLGVVHGARPHSLGGVGCPGG